MVKVETNMALWIREKSQRTIRFVSQIWEGELCHISVM